MSHVMQSLGHNKNPLFTEVCRDSRDRFANFKPTGKQGAPRLLRPTEGCRCSQFDCPLFRRTRCDGSPTHLPTRFVQKLLSLGGLWFIPLQAEKAIPFSNEIVM